MSNSLIEVAAVTKRYGQLVAVDNVSLALSAGQVYGLLGANGAGKSTLIRMIVGITVPDEGRIAIGGQDPTQHVANAKHGLGYLPEELTLYERLTGAEYLQLVAGLKRIDASQIAPEIDFFELSRVRDKWAGEYSLGMRKKLGLAAAMIGGPEVIVLDEPLNGLDVEMMRKLRWRIEAERAAGRTILVSSHVMSFVERVCDRVGIIRTGRLVAEGSPSELREQTAMLTEPFDEVFFHLAQ